MVTDVRHLDRLDGPECWRLVGTQGVGRIGFMGDTHLQIVPTRYDAERGVAHLRASTFGGLARGVHHRAASLQVDHIDPDTFTGWSVLMTGTAHRVDDVAEVAALWSRGRPDPWTPGPETQWIALVVDTIEGQRAAVAS